MSVTLGKKLWQPSLERCERSQLARFMAFLAPKKFSTFEDLYLWSIADIGAFWAAVAAFTSVKWQKPADKPLLPPPPGKIRGGTFFPGATLNFAENLLFYAQKNPEWEALIAVAEVGAENRTARRIVTGAELVAGVKACAAALRQAGVASGDRVAGVIGNVPEAVIAMLATASLGAIWSSCSPDFGVSAVVDRLQQTDPKVIFFTTGYFYGAKPFDCTATIISCIARLPKVEQVVLVDHANAFQITEQVRSATIKQQRLAQVTTWKAFLSTGEEATTKALVFAATSFDHPLYIMFSSGTTGVPKCITHGVGGTLLQHKKELMLHCDLTSQSRLLFYTTCGWMMWNWMVSGLAVGATLVLYEGSVAYPDINSFWQLAATEKVTHLGTSPKFISTCMTSMGASETPKHRQDFSALQTVLTTGAPLLPEHFAWIYDEVKEDVHLASISGGTDIISCFMLGVPTLPVHAGEIQHAGLGMAIEAWNDSGTKVLGQKAELVCIKPFVSMPIGFWNDHEGRKYSKAYFGHFARQGEVWRHGDFIEITKTGGVIVYGRSDATLNPGGVRIGTAELYRQVETLAEITDSIAVGKKQDGDVRIILFVKLKAKQRLTPDLVAKIRDTIRSNLTPRHVPYDIVEVSDIPYTRSGKKVEMAVTQAIHGEKITNLAALVNPEVMAEYVGYGASED